MSELDLNKKEKLLIALREVIPSANYNKDGVNFEDCCGCYSEWTTEACRIAINLNVDAADYSSSNMNKAESCAEDWANKNLEWDGCGCCDNALYVDVRLFDIAQTKGTK